MAVVKMEKINDLYAHLTYSMRKDKTGLGKYISTFNCDPICPDLDFKEITMQRRLKNKRPFSVESWVIYQSFKGNEATPELAHELGNKLAKRYLEGEHQYVVCTHIDSGNIHNHIMFNATKFTDLKSFNSRTKHVVHDLRKVCNDICLEHDLSVIPKGSRKVRGMSLKEHYARKHDRSFKKNIESLIDSCILQSSSWEDFLGLVNKSCEFKEYEYRGKVPDSPARYTVKLPGQERPTRLSRLGLDYSVESIRQRIDDKALKLSAPTPKKTIFDTHDLSDEKFRGAANAGLRSWAVNENIKAKAQAINLSSKLGLTREQLVEKLKNDTEEINSLAAKITETDSEISKLEKYIEQDKVIRDSFALFKEFKEVKGDSARAKFKKDNAARFKRYDAAKKFVSAYANADGKRPRPEAIEKKIEALRTSRRAMYKDYQDKKERLRIFAKEQGANTIQGKDTTPVRQAMKGENAVTGEMKEHRPLPKKKDMEAR